MIQKNLFKIYTPEIFEWRQMKIFQKIQKVHLNHNEVKSKKL